MSKPLDPDFAAGLALYVRAYALMRVTDAGGPMTVEEVIGGLVSVIATAIEQMEPANYRRQLLESTHRALDARMVMAATPTSEAIN